ncbi:MAG: DUF4145 domain-containing protein [Bacteroidota bacterium]|jgi:hypothetical protein
MICPYCNIGIKFDAEDIANVCQESESEDYGFDIRSGYCSECNKPIVLLCHGKLEYTGGHEVAIVEVTEEKIIYPILKPNIPKIEPEVPQNYKSDFTEAAEVLPISPKASAAISRRLLQNIMQDNYKIKKRNLDQEITDFISLPGIPSHLTQAVDAVRNVGNFAAHPLKDTNTGQIVDVEPGEADWLLDVLQSLFDFTFVQPERLKKKQAQLDAKLATLGKPPMKK